MLWHEIHNLQTLHVRREFALIITQATLLHTKHLPVAFASYTTERQCGGLSSAIVWSIHSLEDPFFAGNFPLWFKKFSLLHPKTLASSARIWWKFKVYEKAIQMSKWSCFKDWINSSFWNWNPFCGFEEDQDGGSPDFTWIQRSRLLQCVYF